MTILAAAATLISIGGWFLIRLSEESRRQDDIIAAVLSTPIDSQRCNCLDSDYA